jgi:hypothetical protein
LSPETEHSEESSTLPPPELNPLLNPLLAQNMGRWAHVYFTSPPEKRNEAVQELLRELKAENSTRAETGTPAASLEVQSSSNSSSTTEPTRESEGSSASDELQVQPTLVRCHACGRKNPSTQRFCGLCGARLGEEGAGANLHREDLHREDFHQDDPHQQEVQTSQSHVENQHIQNRPHEAPASYVRGHESQFAPLTPDDYQSSSSTNELSLFQSSRGVGYTGDDADAPAGSGSYRTLAAIVLLILVGALGYLAWRNAHMSSQASRSKPPVSFATEEPASSEPVASSPSKSDAPQQAPAAEKGAGPVHRAVDPTREKPGRAERDRKAKSKNARPSTQAALRTTPEPEKTPQAEIMAGKGAEELTVAQGYLSNTNGQGRNSAEAAKWLWRAVAKHNAEATFLLSDLYLKGDGVSKNCDQARVLLDAATLKGVKGAGERLRHLQAFGCQ